MSTHVEYSRDWMYKFETGEYLREFRGFEPYWCGCFYGDSVQLGGEDEFSHCYDFFSGIGDVEWWISAELEALTDEQKDRLESLMKRNKYFKVNFACHEKIEPLSNYFGVKPHVLYRMGAKSLYRIFQALNDAYNREIDNHTRVIENSSINFGKFDEFMKSEFGSDLIERETKTRCDLFDINEQVIYAPKL